MANCSINRKLKGSLLDNLRAQASLIRSPGGVPYNSPAVEPRKGRNPGKRPQKQMRTPEGWHKAWRKNSALFQNAANTKNTRHPDSERRFAPVLAIVCRPTLRRFAPSLRAQFSFFTLPRGSAASPLHRRAILYRPSGAQNFARQLIADFRFIAL